MDITPLVDWIDKSVLAEAIVNALEEHYIPPTPANARQLYLCVLEDIFHHDCLREPSYWGRIAQR